MKKPKLRYRIYFLLTILIVYFLYCHVPWKAKESFQIEPFTAADRIDSTIDTGDTKFFSRLDHYLIIGFESHEKNIDQIDSFICSKTSEINIILTKFSHYHIYFFKKSNITNNEHIKDEEQDLGQYSMRFDFLYSYEWSYDRFLLRADKEHKHFLDSLSCK